MTDTGYIHIHKLFTYNNIRYEHDTFTTVQSNWLRTKIVHNGRARTDNVDGGRSSHDTSDAEDLSRVQNIRKVMRTQLARTPASTRLPFKILLYTRSPGFRSVTNTHARAKILKMIFF